MTYGQSFIKINFNLFIYKLAVQLYFYLLYEELTSYEELIDKEISNVYAMTVKTGKDLNFQKYCLVK